MKRSKSVEPQEYLKAHAFFLGTLKRIVTQHERLSGPEPPLFDGDKILYTDYEWAQYLFSLGGECQHIADAIALLRKQSNELIMRGVK